MTMSRFCTKNADNVHYDTNVKTYMLGKLVETILMRGHSAPYFEANARVKTICR